MEYAKAMDSIFGLMEVYIKEILVMVKDMDSEYGTMKINRILALIKWIKNKVSVFIHGEVSMFIKVILKMI